MDSSPSNENSVIKLFQAYITLFLVLNTKEDISKNMGNQLTSIVWTINTLWYGYWHSSEYFCLCSAEESNSYRFGTTWGWV